MKIPPGYRAILIGLAAGFFLAGSNLAAKEKDPFAATQTTENQTPRLLLANVWKPSIDPTGWWVSEKYDGLRAYWDGQKLWSRKGNLMHAPEYFLAELPRDIALDGELWIGHGQFEETMSIVRSETPDERWKRIRYMVFDAPQAEGTFESECNSYARPYRKETALSESWRKNVVRARPNSSPSAIASSGSVVKD